MVTYRLANENDYENINSFHNRIYKTNRTIEQFLWEFHDCPFGNSIYVIAEDDGKIIGTNCVILIDLICADKQIVKSGKSEDTLVDPEYRGQKIFYKIYEFLFEKCREANIQVIWGFTSAKKPFKKLGFDVPFDHEQCLAVNNIWKSYYYLSSLKASNKAIDKFKIFGLCCISKIKTIGKFKAQQLALRVEEDNKVVNGVNDLIFENQSKSDSIFAIHQSPEFQDWRIYKNPNYHRLHSFSFYKDNDQLMALIVFNSHANQVAYVCQSTFHPNLTLNEKKRILQYATGKLFDTGIALVRNWLFSTNALNIEELSVHKMAGYTHLERGIGLVWKDLNNVNITPKDFYLSRLATQGVI